MKHKTFKTTENIFRRSRRLILFAVLLLITQSASLQAQIINTVAGNGGSGCSGSGGLAVCASLTYPRGAKTDAHGNLFIADQLNNCIRRVDVLTGNITVAAGKCSSSGAYSGDGGLATAAQLNNPGDVAFDPTTGDMYIADDDNNVIRVVYAVSGLITPASIIGTYVGTYPGTGGFGGDGFSKTGPACQLFQPRGIDMDAAGNLYIADMLNARIRVIRAGNIYTLAGTGVQGYNADGIPATTSELYEPDGVIYDPTTNNVYIADQFNYRIRAVNIGTNIISTVAGNGAVGYTGDGGPATSATLNQPYDVAVDASGNIFIADGLNAAVREVSGGTISSFAGHPPASSGFSGDGGLATAAVLGLFIEGVAVDATTGNVIIGDTYNHRIRVVSGPHATYPTSYNVCIGASITITANVLSGAGTWSTTSTNVTISPSGASCSVTGVSAGTAYIKYTLGGCVSITDTVTVGSCGPVCSDTCYWKVTGNNIIGGNNTFGTLTNDDIKFTTNSTFRGVLQGAGNGNWGINTSSPSTFLDVDCTPPTIVPAPSGLRFENLPTGHGNVLVVDPSGYVYAANSIAYKHNGNSGDDNTDLQNQINQLQQQINDLKNLLTVNGINIQGSGSGDMTGNSLSVSPNPTSGQANATYSIANDFTSAAIRVTDNTGKLILEKPVSGHNGTVDFTIPGNVVSNQLSCSLIVDSKILATQKLVLLNK